MKRAQQVPTTEGAVIAAEAEAVRMFERWRKAYMRAHVCFEDSERARERVQRARRKLEEEERAAYEEEQKAKPLDDDDGQHPVEPERAS